MIDRSNKKEKKCKSVNKSLFNALINKASKPVKPKKKQRLNVISSVISKYKFIYISL